MYIHTHIYIYKINIKYTTTLSHININKFMHKDIHRHLHSYIYDLLHLYIHFLSFTKTHTQYTHIHNIYQWLSTLVKTNNNHLFGWFTQIHIHTQRTLKIQTKYSHKNLSLKINTHINSFTQSLIQTHYHTYTHK